jgi:anti-sigma B factor antagonist
MRWVVKRAALEEYDVMKTLDITGEMTIYTAAEQKDQLLAFIESGHVLEINLAQVSEIDTAGLQLLILTKQEAVHSQKKLRFVMHSDAVLDVLELANLTGAFGDPSVTSGNQEQLG